MSSSDSSVPGSQTTRILAIVLASIVGFCAFLVGSLFLMKWHTQRRRALAMPPAPPDLEAGSQLRHRRNSSISVSTMSTAATPRKAVFVISEKELAKSASPLASPALPEIRITFPEEIDNAGQRQPGRVVSVRISENGSEGFEPYDEKLSSYQRDANDRFHSLDLDRMGGLKEKEVKA